MISHYQWDRTGENENWNMDDNGKDFTPQPIEHAAEPKILTIISTAMAEFFRVHRCFICSERGRDATRACEHREPKVIHAQLELLKTKLEALHGVSKDQAA